MKPSKHIGKHKDAKPHFQSEFSSSPVPRWVVTRIETDRMLRAVSLLAGRDAAGGWNKGVLLVVYRIVSKYNS